MGLKSLRPLLLCDLDLSISKEVVNAERKNDFISAKWSFWH